VPSELPKHMCMLERSVNFPATYDSEAGQTDSERRFRTELFSVAFDSTSTNFESRIQLMGIHDVQKMISLCIVDLVHISPL
jgi:hypothetical protein